MIYFYYLSNKLSKEKNEVSWRYHMLFHFFDYVRINDCFEESINIDILYNEYKKIIF
jgi:hypothetical protein